MTDSRVAALRAASAHRAKSRIHGPELAAVTDVHPEGLRPMRLYSPAEEARPLIVYLHGGGFVMGGLDSHDATCRRLARYADVAVLAVDYRLAPEHPGPAAVDDAVEATQWAARHPGDVGTRDDLSIGIAGDSSGGAVAALAACQLRDFAPTFDLAALVLLCPNTDMTLSQPSVEANGHGWALEADDLRWFVEQWVPDPARRTCPSLSPLHAQLVGLPPTIVATAEHDPLRDEGTCFAAKLREAGVPVDHRQYGGLVHGFVQLTDVSTAAADATRDVFQHAGYVIRNGLA